MEDIIGSVRRSLVGKFPKHLSPSLKPIEDDKSPPIRWKKGEMIGSGAFGQVFKGLNLDSGGFLAVKQVPIPSNCAWKEQTQAHIREIEKEVNLLKNLSHPNIVRYFGTATEAGSLNILLEYVPGGSISSVLGNFGSFSEPVIKLYTKQLLLGLEYLHNNGIMHRDIKGANILIDDKGCIKLADFGASKKVVKLATMTKSCKGTPNWMAPEVICQTGHSFSADIWSVGCTVIEMATGKPPYSQEYNEVFALLHHIGSTKSPPTIPNHLSAEAKDFLSRCLEKEPSLRPSAPELLQHPFITGEFLEHPSVLDAPYMENSRCLPPVNLTNSMTVMGGVCVSSNTLSGSKSFWRGNGNDDDMCEIFDKDDFLIDAPKNINSSLLSNDCSMGFKPLSERKKEWKEELDQEVDMKRACAPNIAALPNSKKKSIIPKSPSKSGSPKRTPSRKMSTALETAAKIVSPGKLTDQMCGVSISGNQKPNHSDHPSELNESLYDSLQEPISMSPGFAERKKEWKEELDQELDMKREALRLAGGGRMCSPKR